MKKILSLLLLFACLAALAACEGVSAPGDPSITTAAPVTLAPTTAQPTTQPRTVTPEETQFGDLLALLHSEAPTEITAVYEVSGIQIQTLTDTKTWTCGQADGVDVVRLVTRTQRQTAIQLDEHHRVVSTGSVSETKETLWLDPSDPRSYAPGLGIEIDPASFSSLTVKTTADGTVNAVGYFNSTAVPDWAAGMVEDRIISGSVSLTRDGTGGHIVSLGFLFTLWENDRTYSVRVTITYDYTPRGTLR